MLYRKSIWVFHLNTGGCNACDIEILDVITPYHDVERLGIKLVASPRHADMILMTGPVTREVLPKAVEAVLAVPEPKVIIAVGSCACGGGIWYDAYPTIGGVESFLKIMEEEYSVKVKAIYVPGCPPKPESIIYGIALALDMVKQKIKRQVYEEK